MKKKEHKKRATKKATRSYSFYITLAAIFVVATGILIALGYYFGYQKGHSDAYVLYESEHSTSKRAIAKLEAIINQKNMSTKELNERLKKVLKDEIRRENSTARHELDTAEKIPPLPTKSSGVKQSAKPKLAIIIDDVSFARDVKAIKSLHYPLTMSFLPPSTIHPNSAKLAAKEKFYMVHLPLEATNFSAVESSTLTINDSQKVISDKIRAIKREFPKVRFINNHTGSKFTANERAMNRLIYALKQNHIFFIDSRTTAKTKAPIVMKNYGYKYVARDVFLDHVSDISEIKKQLRRAIKLAKKRGRAIAIGHPHKKTIQALRESKGLLNEVELVPINELI